MIQNVFFTAHSGADGTPDNSLAFVRYALSTGADCLEVDVRKNQKTGKLQLGHDALQEEAVPLQEAFALLKTHPFMKINCDLKEPGLEKPVLALAEECGVTDRIIFSGTVAPLEVEDPEFRRERICWNIEEQIPNLYERCKQDRDFRLVAAEMMCDKMDAVGVETINSYYGLVDEEFLKLVAKRGKTVSVWTVNNMEKLDWFFAQGVKNITTRRIDKGLQNCRLGHREKTSGDCILRKEFWWKPEDSRTDEKMSFRVADDVDALEVHFHYTPGEEACDEYCQEPVEAAMKLYYGEEDPASEPMTAQQWYPIKNLVTVSATQNGEYVGNAHRWDTDQTHLFTTGSASQGFSTRKTMGGDWEIQLHLHCIISPRCRGFVEIMAHRYIEIPAADMGEELVRTELSEEHASGTEGALRWYPVELHTHSQHSDGDCSVPAMIQRAKEMGFCGFALSDHNSQAGIPELLRETARCGIVPIEGLEWTTYFGHMLVLGERGYTDWRGVGTKDMDEAIVAIHKNQGVVGVAHPKSIADPIKTGYRWLFEVQDWSKVDFLEVWSRNDAPVKVQTKGAFALWDALLDQGFHITGTSGRDYHRPDDKVYAHTFVGCPGSLTEEQVFQAIRQGRICAAMGPLLTVEGFSGELTAECGDTIPAGSLTIRWNVTCDKLRNDFKQDKIIPKRVRLIQNGKEAASQDITSWDCDPEKVWKGAFTIEAEPGWIRAELVGEYFGKEEIRIAFANPFYVA